MPYIGRDLNRGNYLKLDDISSSFNGSTTTFNLTVGGSAFTPGSAFSILVSVGGVIQEPESAYQVNNSEITFANAPTAQDSFFCIALAVPIGIGVPGNGTVNGTQMAKPFNYDGYFYLDDANNRVGINSSSPTVALDVIGNIKLNGNLVTGGGSGGINAGVVTATGLDLNGNGDVSGNFVIGGDLTVNGTTSTIDTNLIGVDRVEIGANSNTVAGIAVTQSGSADLVRLYDGSTQVVTVDDEGKVGLGSAIPSQKLDVDGTVKATLFSGSGASLTGIVNANVAANAAIAGSKITPNFGTQTLNAGLGYFSNNLNTTGTFSLTGGTVQINFNRASHTPVYRISLTGGSNPTMNFRIKDTTNNLDRFIIRHGGQIEIPGDVGIGHTVNFSNTNISKFSGYSTLHIKGPSSNGAAIRLQDNGDTADSDDFVIYKDQNGGYLRVNGTDPLIAHMNGDEKVRITAAGDVGIGTAVPVVAANYGNLSLAGSSGGQLEFKRLSNDVRHYIWGNASLNIGGGYTNGSSSDIRVFVNGSNERLRITKDGEMLIGTNGADRLIAGQNFNSSNGWSGTVQIEKKNPTQGNSNIPMLAITAYNGANNQYTGGISFNRSNHNAQGTQGAVTTNQQLGNIAFNGSDGTNFIQGAEIFAIPDQTFATNDGPASLVFATTPDGTSEDAPQERLRIDSSGQITPGVADTQDLGSTSKEFRNLYLGDSGSLYIGSDQNIRIWHNSGTNNNNISNGSGNLYINATSSHEVGILVKANNSVDLYYDSSTYTTPKLSTTATGIEVTGEVAASQDYPVVKPTLDLNFAGTAKLDSRVTFTREGSGSYYGRDGLLKFAAYNEPRFDHDPITRECKGLLIEEQRQNFAPNSYRASNDDGGTAYDHGYNMINNAVTINDFGTAPDGTNTATKMYPASSGSARGIELITSVPSTGNYTNSIYVKAAGHTGWIALYGINGGARAYFNPSTGAKGGSGGTGAPSSGQYGIQDVGNGWYRIHLTVNQTNLAAADYHYIYFGDSDNSTTVTASGTNGILMWGLQIEKGDFPTSYIRTDGYAKQFRGADQCYIDGQDFLDFYNQTEGTMISSHSILSDQISSSHNLYTYQISPTGATAYAPLRLLDKNGSYGNSLTAASVYNTTVFLVQPNGSPVTVAGRKYKVAVSIKKDDYNASFNGENTQSDNSGDLYTADHISIGYYKPSPQAYLNGHIQRLTYYPFKLTDNQLKTVTS